MHSMSGEGLPLTMFGEDESQSHLSFPVQPITFLPERHVEDPTPGERLIQTLRDVLQQYSNMLEETTKRQVADSFERPQDLCPTVERLSAEAEDSLKRYNERYKSITKHHTQTAGILKNLLKALRPPQDNQPFDNNIVSLAKEIDEKLRSLQFEYSNFQATKTKLRTEAAASEALLNKLGQEHSARIQQLSQAQNAAAERNIKDLQNTIDQQIANSFRTFQAINSELESKIAAKDHANVQMQVELKTITALADSSQKKITDLQARLSQLSHQSEEFKTQNSQLRAEAETLRSRNSQLTTQLQQSSKDLQHSRSENAILKTSLDQSTQKTDDLRIEMSALRKRLNEVSHTTASTSTASKRPSVTTFSPDKASAKKVAIHRSTRSHSSRASVDSDCTHSGSPGGVILTPIPPILPIPNSSRQLHVRVPSRQQPFTPPSITSHATPSYPEDAASVGSIRIDIKAVSEGRWPAEVSDVLQEKIKEYLQWAMERKKSFAVPKHSSSDRICNWHTIARNPSYPDCVWNVNEEGMEDKYHACADCGTRGELCFVLERENVLVLLPLLPSQREAQDVGPHDLSYWLNHTN